MRIRTIAPVAVAGLLAGSLAVSASAQGGDQAALIADLRTQCASQISSGMAISRSRGQSMAEVERGLSEGLAALVGPDITQAQLQEIVDNADELAGEGGAAAFFRCAGATRIAQLRNGNRPVSQAAAPAPRAPASAPAPARSASADLCEEMGKELQAQSRNWPETGNARALRLGREQKALFTTGACAGTPNAPTWIAQADRMISAAGSTGGSPGGGSTAVLDHSGRVVRSSGDETRAADVRENPSNPSAGVARSVTPRVRRMTTASPGFPVPDANRCLKIIEAGPSGVCRKEDPSMAVRIANGCSEVMSMQLCVYNATARNWRCGSGTYGRHRDENTNDLTVFRSECNTNGEYLIAFCSEASRRASNGGSCGGDPNTQGY